MFYYKKPLQIILCMKNFATSSQKSSITSGFTLIELAVVIIIIGLLVAGVMQGQEIINQAKQKNIITSIESYKSATNLFRSKYNDLPGDSTRHAAFFPGAGITEGNGNGRVDSNNESYEYWRALSLAKIIKGSYSGVVAQIQNNSFPKDDSNNNYIYKCASMPGHGALWGNSTTCYYSISRFPTGTGWAPVNVGYPAFTVQEVFEMDTKFDDGIASSGNIIAYRPSTGMAGCTNPVDAFSSTSGNYIMTTTGVVCVMGYIFNP